MPQEGTWTVLRNGVLAGAAGGLAEIAWVSVYAGMTGMDPGEVARAVTTAAGLGSLFPAMPAALGITVHMTLALALGIALAAAWERIATRTSGAANPYWVALPALAAVWAFNFFVVLPVVDPPFVHLLPYAVSLTSKLLFGLAAAEVLRQSVSGRARARKAQPATVR